jgi:FlaG/FlaF family flagellin (archaellin)
VAHINTPTQKPYIIYLTKVADSTFDVAIYSSFTGDESNTYYVKYNRYSGPGKTIPNHREILNSEKVFSESDTLGPNKYVVQTTENSEGYRFNVQETAFKMDRSPVIFRWRLHHGDITSPWKTEQLLDRKTLQDVDYIDKGGEYEDGDDEAYLVAKKILAPSPESCYDTPADGTYAIELEIYSGETWVSNVDSIRFFIQSGNPVKVWINPVAITDTGTAGSYVNMYKKRFPAKQISFTVEGKSTYTEVSSTPGKDVDMARESAGATIGWVNEAQVRSDYFYLDSLDRTLSGANATLTSQDYNWAGSTSLKDLVEFSKSIVLGKTTEGVLAYVNGVTSRNVEILVNLSRASSLRYIDVMLGKRGSLVSASLYPGANGTGSPVVVSSFTLEEMGVPYIRHYKHTLSPNVQTMSIKITIRPESYRVTDHGWLAELFGFKDRYVAEFSFYGLTAREVIDPIVNSTNHEWQDSRVFTFGMTKDSPYSVDLKDIINSSNLKPPDSSYNSDCYYNVIPGDADSVNDITANMSILDENGVPKFVNISGDPAWRFSYSEATTRTRKITCTTDAYDVYQSSRYTINNSIVPTIYVEQYDRQNSDEMWFPKISAGWFSIKENIETTAQGITVYKVKKYYVPEFGSQAFYPAIPYMQQTDEAATFIDNTVISVANKPLYVTIDGSDKPDITVTRNGVAVGVKDWDRHKGYIYLDSEVEFNDDIRVTYIYEQKFLMYKGFASGGEFYHLDLNPMPGHTYTDLSTQAEVASSSLVSKAIYLYVLPAYVYYSDNRIPARGVDGSAIRHMIVDESIPDSDTVQAIGSIDSDALIIGKILVKPDASTSDILVLDTRQRGGGVMEDITRDLLKKYGDEATYLWDIGSWDGHPYPSNGVAILTLPSSLLIENGGKFTEDDIRQLLNKYIAFGIYVIIRYQ